MPTPKVHKSGDNSVSSGSVAVMPDNNSNHSSRGRGSPEETTIAADEIEERGRTDKNRNSRVSVSNEDNVLLDPEVLTDFPTQALVLTILVSFYTFLIRN